MTATHLRLGITYVPYLPPEHLRDLAQAAEECGLDDLWVWEDCFKESGIASAAVALASTERVRVGLGLMPTPLRNVALTAMEVATLQRIFPGRFVPGVGHGVQSWMAQVGGRVESPMTLLEEYLTALRQLLGGEEVSVEGRYVRLDRVRLDWPPGAGEQLTAGGFGPRTIELSARLTDAVLISAGQSEAELRAAVDRATAAAPGDRTDVVYSLVTTTGPDARARADADLAQWGVAPERTCVAAGSAQDVAEGIRRCADAGATTVVVQPTADLRTAGQVVELVEFVGREVRPLLG